VGVAKTQPPESNVQSRRGFAAGFPASTRPSIENGAASSATRKMQTKDGDLRVPRRFVMRIPPAEIQGEGDAARRLKALFSHRHPDPALLGVVKCLAVDLAA